MKNFTRGKTAHRAARAAFQQAKDRNNCSKGTPSAVGSRRRKIKKHTHVYWSRCSSTTTESQWTQTSEELDGFELIAGSDSESKTRSKVGLSPTGYVALRLFGWGHPRPAKTSARPTNKLAVSGGRAVMATRQSDKPKPMKQCTDRRCINKQRPRSLLYPKTWRVRRRLW